MSDIKCKPQHVCERFRMVLVPTTGHWGATLCMSSTHLKLVTTLKTIPLGSNNVLVRTVCVRYISQATVS